MPFTLDQLDFLGAHVGVVIPPEFIENKRRAEEFKKRYAALSARSGEMKKRRDGAALEDLFKRASQSADAKDFAAALKLLDDLEKGLAVPEPSPSQTEAKPVGAPKVATATGSNVLFIQSQLAWEKARKTVQVELQKFEQAILAAAVGEPNLEVIAQHTKKLYTVLGGMDENLRDKLDEAVKAQSTEEKTKLHGEVKALIQKTIAYVNSQPLLAVIDNNPFGKFDVKGCVTTALNALNSKFA